jgi:phage recombination protein Bet
MTDESTALALPDDDVEIVIPARPNVALWADLNEERRGLLRDICGAAASKDRRALTDGEMMLLCEIGHRTGLDPFQKQIYALIFQGKFTVMTSIGGFRAVARRNGLAGIDAPKYSWADEKKTTAHACQITVHRWGPPDVNGRREKEDYTAQCFLDEFQGNTPIWRSKPKHMLAKCTEAVAHRMAFTETLGDLYTSAEFAPAITPRAAQVRSTTSAKALLAPEPEATPEQPIDTTAESDPSAAFYASDEGPP